MAPRADTERLKVLSGTRQKRLRRQLFACIRELPQYPIDIADQLREPYWKPLLPHLENHPEGSWVKDLPARALYTIPAFFELSAYRAALEDFVLTELRFSKGGQPMAWAMDAVQEDIRDSPSLGGGVPVGIARPQAHHPDDPGGHGLARWRHASCRRPGPARG